MPAQQTNHIVYPGPTGETGDDAQFGKVDRNRVKMARMAKIVGAVVGVVHRGINAHRHIKLDAFGV